MAFIKEHRRRENSLERIEMLAERRERQRSTHGTFVRNLLPSQWPKTRIELLAFRKAGGNPRVGYCPS